MNWKPAQEEGAVVQEVLEEESSGARALQRSAGEGRLTLCCRQQRY